MASCSPTVFSHLFMTPPDETYANRTDTPPSCLISAGSYCAMPHTETKSTFPVHPYSPATRHLSRSTPMKTMTLVTALASLRFSFIISFLSMLSCSSYILAPPASQVSILLASLTLFRALVHPHCRLQIPSVVVRQRIHGVRTTSLCFTPTYPFPADS